MTPIPDLDFALLGRMRDITAVGVECGSLLMARVSFKAGKCWWSKVSIFYLFLQEM